MNPLVILQVVSWNSGAYISECIDSLVAQKLSNYRSKIVVIDNASEDNTHQILKSKGDSIDVTCLEENLGFTGAHNLGIKLALKEGADYICLINPDLTLELNAIEMLILATQIGPRIGASTPLLYRSRHGEKTQILDACGMELLNNLRHLDKGSNQSITEEFSRPQYVFGGTGACLMLTKDAILDISYPANLKANWQTAQFFDPLFFAYREDAEVSLRLQLRGWRVRYEPKAIGYHVRQVLPENRLKVDDKINGLSVRNRFLIQANSAPLAFLILTFPMCMIRNILVIFACLIKERTSLPYLKEIHTFRADIIKKRKWNLSKKLTGSLTLSSIVEGSNRSKEVALVKDETPERIFNSVHAVIVAFYSSVELKQNLESVLKVLNEVARAKLTLVNNSPDDLDFKEVQNFISEISPKYQNVLIEIENTEINLGFGGATNKALINSQYDAYLVLNSDIGLEELSLNKLLVPFSLYKNLAVLSPLIKDKETKQIQFQYLARRFPRFRDVILDLIKPISKSLRSKLEAHRSYADFQAMANLIENDNIDNLLEVEQVSGACLLIKASTFNLLKGFNTEFYPAWYEDVDLCKRISELGMSSCISNSSSVSHLGAESLHSLSSRRFIAIFLGNKVKYYKLHEPNCLKRNISISLIYLEFILKLLSISIKEYKRGEANESNIINDLTTFFKNQVLAKPKS